MTTKTIKNRLSILLFITALVILVNTLVQNTPIWYIVNVIYVLIPLIFSFTCIRSSMDGIFIAILLWIPAFVVVYMAFQGFFGIDHPIWKISNMYQLFIYGYFAGTRLTIK